MSSITEKTNRNLKKEMPSFLPRTEGLNIKYSVPHFPLSFVTPL